MTTRQILPAVVVDLGSVFIKCGFAGEGAPRLILPSPIAECLSEADPLSVPAWERIMATLFRTLFFRTLQIKPHEHRIVICEQYLAPSALRDGVARVLFEKFNVSDYALLFCARVLTFFPPPPLRLYQSISLHVKRSQYTAAGCRPA